MQKTLTVVMAFVALLFLATGCGAAQTAPTASPVATLVPASETPTLVPTFTPAPSPSPTPLNPLTIAALRQRDYPGSNITFEQTLAPGSNYSRYIVSYLSDGLKIYALLTIPKATRPKTGFPIIIFNHGYIPPAQYRTTERYVAYVDAIARSGYIVIKPDYRGHGNSEGVALGGYGTPDYTIDDLNALASVKRLPDADPNRIGMWGHSMGGQVTLRAAVISKDIKAEVIWSGVVAPYPDLINHWRRAPNIPTPVMPDSARRWRAQLEDQYGSPDQNPAFWASISPNSYLSDLSGPMQLQATRTDPEVPYEFSQTLAAELQAVGRPAEFFTYANDDHNLSRNLTVALQRSVAFFDKYVKGSK